MKIAFGSRPVLQDGDAMETLHAVSVRGKNWSGSVGTPDRTVVEDAVERMLCYPGGVETVRELTVLKTRVVKGIRRAFTMPGEAPWHGEALARALFRAAGVAEGNWTWTVTSTRQTFSAWRTA